MNSEKNTARIVGILFIGTTIAGMLSVVFFGSNLQSPVDLAKIATNETWVRLGAFFYFLMAAGVAGIAISMYSTLKKHNEGLALGAVCFRVIEGATYIVGVICVLSIVVLSQTETPADPYYQTLGELLLAGQHLAQSLIPGVFAFSLGALMYNFIFFQTKLIPRWLSIWGLIAATLVFISGLLNLVGDPSLLAISELLNFPNFLGEIVLAVWLIVKGFNSAD
jgi:hypothetical protein